ncbi:hypothetical protein GCM10023146_20650 [Nocardioides caricicola]
MPPAGTPSRSAYALRNAATAASAFDSDGEPVPRFDNGPVRVAAMAAPTWRGVWVPAGESKWAVPESRDGKWLRSSVTS